MSSPISDESIDTTCSICFADWANSCVRVLPCKHTFHRACLDRWEDRSNDCPYCRQPIKEPRTVLAATLANLLKSLGESSNYAAKLNGLCSSHELHVTPEDGQRVANRLEELSQVCSTLSMHLRPEGPPETLPVPEETAPASASANRAFLSQGIIDFVGDIIGGLSSLPYVDPMEFNRLHSHVRETPQGREPRLFSEVASPRDPLARLFHPNGPL